MIFAVVLAAFSLQEHPRGASSSLSAQAFDGTNAAGTAQRLRADPAFARRSPGAPGDDRLADRLQVALRGLGFSAAARPARVRTIHGHRTSDLVIARRTGLSDGTLAVVADRSSLGATAALLELGRVLGGRSPTRTLVLASVAGGPGGGGTAALA